MMPFMPPTPVATNGQASPLFNDRRGQNPFQPVIPSTGNAMTPGTSTTFRANSMSPRSTISQIAQHSVSAIPYQYDSYIGHGLRMPNGAAPLRSINGHGTLRENPDTLNLQQRRLSIGDGLT